MVRDGEDGLVVEPGDPLTLGEAISRLLTDRPLAQRIGSSGRQSVQRRFTLDRMVEHYCAVFDDLTVGRRQEASRTVPGARV
jgi:glycosyltransferase involved in cell wall biosynthesis